MGLTCLSDWKTFFGEPREPMNNLLIIWNRLTSKYVLRNLLAFDSGYLRTSEEKLAIADPDSTSSKLQSAQSHKYRSPLSAFK